MDIQYASDLHLEFPVNRTFIKQNPLLPKAETLILAGDIILLRDLERHQDFFSYLSDSFKTVYWIAGNHEYYHFDIVDKCGAFCENIRSNVFLLNNTTAVVDGVHLVFSTLWSKISETNRWNIERGLNDFKAIIYMGNHFTADLYNQLHIENLKFLKKELARLRGDRVVVTTHHVPTFLGYPEKYKGDGLHEAFATELFDFIKYTQPNYWIYGHHHYNSSGIKIGNTRLQTNQLGYLQHKENEGFVFDKTIEL